MPDQISETHFFLTMEMGPNGVEMMRGSQPHLSHSQNSEEDLLHRD